MLNERPGFQCIGHPDAVPDRAVAQLPIYIAIATAGRRDILSETLEMLARQTRRPNRVLICPAEPEDFDRDGARDLPLEISVVTSAKGSCHQRNAIIDALRGEPAGLITFFDDDFFPMADYLERAGALFRDNPDIAAASGLLLADGAVGPGLTVEAARAIMQDENGAAAGDAPRPLYNAYGCNMTVRLGILHEHHIRFDENLPLYAWLEDVDLSRRLATYGRIVSFPAMRGVHLGTKRGRSSGVRLGYSQIANPWHLLRKRTMRLDRALAQAARNIAANIRGSFKPEPWVDRKGRLYGNLLALRDLVLRRIHPANILKFK